MHLSSPRDNFDLWSKLAKNALLTQGIFCYLLENVDINPLRDFRYTLLRSICADALDMFASQTRDLYHIETDRKGGYIEFERSENISSETK